ncbi:MAG TPA: PIN domain-containing protein [Chthoniobacterales bacterium]
MILIDTSAWIEFFRARGEPALKSRVADCLSIGQAAYTCPIRFELLLGARPSEVSDLLIGLDLARRLALTASHWDAAATLGSRLRADGVTVPASDLLIATLAEKEGIPLLARDRHFEIIRDSVLPKMKLVVSGDRL